MRSHKLKISLLALLSCFIWSTAFASVKYGLLYFKPFLFAGMRFMIAGIMILPFCPEKKEIFFKLRSNMSLIIRVAFFQTFLLYATFFIGMTLVPAAVAAIIIGSSPLLTALLAHILTENDRIKPGKMLNIFIGISGIVIVSISRNPFESSGRLEIVGIIILLIGSIASALGNIIVSKSDSEIDPFTLNSWQMILGSMLLIILSLVFEGVPELKRPVEAYAALCWLSFVAASAFSLWFMLLKTPGVLVSELNIWKFTLPVFGAVLSWIFVPGEKPEYGSVAGLIILVFAILRHYRKQEIRLKNRAVKP